jgi:predicted transcriptional regulator
MKISFSQIIDIKCILAGKTKKQIANELGISQMTLSREIKDAQILSDLNEYFNEIDQDINFLCDKLREETKIDMANDDGAEYQTNNKIKAIERELHAKNMEIVDYRAMEKLFEKHSEQWQKERDDLLKKIWTLETENIQFKEKLGIKDISNAS